MRTIALAGLLAVSAAAGCAQAEESDGAQSADQNLDALDLANSWTDAANPKTPDAAGPLWWSWVMKMNGPKHSLRSVVAGRPREPVGVFAGPGFAETGAFSLAPGSYGILVQYKENENVDPAAALGEVRLRGNAGGRPTTDENLGTLTAGQHPIGAGGWRRAYLHFDIAAPSDVLRIHIENGSAAVEWQFGLVAVHREGRPFYGIAHNPDSVARLDAAVAEGANALEPDLRQSDDAPGITSEEDGSVAVTEEGLTGGASTANGQAKLTTYMRELAAIAPRKLVIWDTKVGTTKDFAELGRTIQRVGERVGYDFSKSVINISQDTMTGLYQPFESSPGVGRCFDGIFTQVHSHTADEWMSPVRANRLTFQGLGVAPQLQITEKWSAAISVYVRAREQEAFPNKIYFWTVNDADAMRRVLDLGIDGLITDEIARLRSILREEPHASMYRYAGDDDDHAAKHGGTWFRVESSAGLDR